MFLMSETIDTFFVWRQYFCSCSDWNLCRREIFSLKSSRYFSRRRFFSASSWFFAWIFCFFFRIQFRCAFWSLWSSSIFSFRDWFSNSTCLYRSAKVSSLLSNFNMSFSSSSPFTLNC